MMARAEVMYGSVTKLSIEIVSTPRPEHLLVTDYACLAVMYWRARSPSSFYSSLLLKQ